MEIEGGVVKMRTLVFLFLAFATVAAAPKNPQKIVGGSETTISEYPSIVALLFTYDFSIWFNACGGAILNTRSVLTAGHCPYGEPVRACRVRVGSTIANSGGVVYSMQTYIIHPQYHHGNDIAIMRTASNIAYVYNAVQPGTIAGSNYNLADNEVVWAAGWGDTADGNPPNFILRHVQVWTINHEICAARYAETGGLVNENMLCIGWLDVGGRDQCVGDSGSPVYHNGIVVGICSWGYECGSAHTPGVNVRVSSHTPWILANA